MQSKPLLFKRILKSVLYLFSIGVGLCLIFYFSVNWGAFGHVYSEEELQDFENEVATVVLSEEGKTIGRFFAENREVVEFDSIPNHLIQTLVATEDARYYEHEGVDSRSMLRVLFKSIILNDKSSGGGSTITQQLAKNMYGRGSHGVLSMPVNKCKEIILANRLETVYSKNEILALYLNTIPFGENVYGIQSASKRFFNKPVRCLKIEEGAVLIGMLKANTYYNPRLYPDHALKRRNTVLQQVEKFEALNEQEVDSLSELPLVLDYMNMNNEGPAGYFLVEVKKEANAILKAYNDTAEVPLDLEKDGLKIKTTLNYKLQDQVNKAYRVHLSKMQKLLSRQYNKGKSKSIRNKIAELDLKKNKLSNEIKNREFFGWDGFYTDSISTLDSIKKAMIQLHAGFLAMNPQNGAIRAWGGGINFNAHPYDQVKAKRQLASTFKPLLYAAAVENGRRPCDYVSNEKIELTDFKDWSPENYDHTSGGKYSFAAALAKSKNIPAVRVYFETGFQKVNRLWKDMGFSSKLSDNPSLALGTASASVLELAQAYSSFANGGYKVDHYCIQEIRTKNGKLLYKTDPGPVEAGEEVVSENTAHVISAILRKAINQGTGTPIRKKYGMKIPFAGKTGTSQNYSDAWFVGYNPGVIMVSRVGANSPNIHFNSGSNGSGSRLALPLVGEVLKGSCDQSDLKMQLSTSFPPEVRSIKIGCEDFIDENKLDKFLKKFQKKNRSLEDEKKRAKRRKNNPLKRLFKW